MFSADSHFHGKLSFCGSGDQRRIRCKGNFGGEWSLLLSKILGTNPEGSTISFTVPEERAITIHFSSEAAQIAEHEAFLRFEREEFGLMPPSSSSSSSEGD